jgi:RimJ/RimL family protein N-acetyltransferase
MRGSVPTRETPDRRVNLGCGTYFTPAGSLAIRPTTERDLDWVLSLESRADNAPYVTPWARARHRAAMADRSMAHWVLSAGAPVGYVILRDVRVATPALEIVRLVVSRKGRGHGRLALRLVKAFAFEQLEAHRLWLDVFEFNERARGLYLSEGFREEGVLRDAVARDGGFESLVVMSLLAGEYIPAHRSALPLRSRDAGAKLSP